MFSKNFLSLFLASSLALVAVLLVPGNIFQKILFGIALSQIFLTLGWLPLWRTPASNGTSEQNEGESRLHFVLKFLLLLALVSALALTNHFWMFPYMSVLKRFCFLVLLCLPALLPILFLRWLGWEVGPERTSDMVVQRVRGNSKSLITFPLILAATVMLGVIVARQVAEVADSTDLMQVLESGNLFDFLWPPFVIGVGAGVALLLCLALALNRRAWMIHLLCTILVITIVVLFFQFAAPKHLDRFRYARFVNQAWHAVGICSWTALVMWGMRLSGLRWRPMLRTNAASESATEPELPKRRFQFNLRGILVAMLIIGAPLAWVTSVIRQANQLNAQLERWQESGVTPTVEEGHVTSLMGVDPQKLSEDDLNALKKRRQLTSLQGEHFTDEHTKLFSNLTELTSLTLRNSTITDEGLKNFENLKELYQLNLQGSSINGKSLNYVGQRRLATVNLADTLLDDRGVSRLNAMVRNVNAQGTKVTLNGAMQFLLNHIAVKRFQFPNGEYSDGKLIVRGDISTETFKNMVKVASVKSLELQGATFNEELLVHLPVFPNLTELNLSGLPLTNQGLKVLAGVASLQVLHLENTKIDDEGAAFLKYLPNLTSLNLRGTRITDASLLFLDSKPNLAQLDVSGTKVSAVRLLELADKRRPETATRLTGFQASSGSLVGLNAAAGQLKEAGLKLNLSAQDEPFTAKQFLQMKNTATVIKNLTLDGAKFDEALLVHLRTLPDMLSVSITNSPITEVGLSHLLSIEGLGSLCVHGTNISSNRLVEAAREHPELTIVFPTLNARLTGSELTLERTVSSDALARITKLKTLKLLNLKQNKEGTLGFEGGHVPYKKITPAEMDALQEFEGLTDLNIVNAENLPKSLAIASNLPNLKTLTFQSSYNSSSKSDTFTAADLAFVQRFPKLTLLNLSGQIFAPGALASLKSASLEQLQLANSNLSDADVTPLSGLPKLRELTLSHNPITDAIVPVIQKLPSIERMILYGTRLTPTGFAKLPGKTTTDTMPMNVAN